MSFCKSLIRPNLKIANKNGKNQANPTRGVVPFLHHGKSLSGFYCIKRAKSLIFQEKYRNEILLMIYFCVLLSKKKRLNLLEVDD